DNNAQDGGGILIFSGELLIEGGQISNNTASRKGGGISTYEGTEFIMSSGVISNNKGLEGGGGVFVSDNSEFIMSGGKIHNNETEGLGGGVFVNGSFIMTDGNISSNKANYISEHEIKIFITEGGRLLLDEWLSVWDDYSGVGGGIYINEDSEFIMLGGEITKNEAVSGGGILNYGDFILRNGIISENTSHFGGGVYFCNGSFLMEDGIIRNNKSYGMGGGIHIDKEIDFIMSGGIITHNEALVGGGIMVEGNFIFKNGEISFNHSHEDGGGLCITRNADFIMSGGKILKNESNFEGGGIVIYGNATLSNFIISGNQAKLYGGGVLLKNTGTLVMKDGDISLNQSNNGGGISTYGTINISGTTITGNQAIRGGGIYNFGQINIQDCILSENKALYGGAFYSGDNSFSEIKNSNITGNYASINGGGLMCLVTNNKTYLNNVNINNNKSLSGGGIYIGDGAYISISSNITNNYAKRGSALFSERIGIYEFSNVSSMNPDEIYTEE
ncbi:MAG: hypothetical protein FWD13_13030, partial [Treponema sp.]|nr:hypothetical protein [Treponema sp.]